MVTVSADLFENFTNELPFHELFNDIFHFSVAQKFVDFVFFTCLNYRGKV